MLDDLEESVRGFVLDVCSVLYKYGYAEVSVGAIMRLMGLSGEQVSAHDDELILLNEDFEKLLEKHQDKTATQGKQDTIPPDVTVH